MRNTEPHQEGVTSQGHRAQNPLTLEYLFLHPPPLLATGNVHGKGVADLHFKG